MGGAIAVSSKKRRRQDVLPDINVTPLVDVVLVLLIIFMVIAPELEHGERVELPAITTPDPKSKPKVEPLTVTISAKGNYFVEKEQIADLDALSKRVKADHDQEPERRILLKGDASVPYEKFRATLSSFQAVGLPGVSLSVTQKGGEKGESAPAEGE